MPETVYFDVHAHTLLTDGTVTGADGTPLDGEEEYPYRVEDYIDARKLDTDAYILGITEYDRRYPNSWYVEQLEADGYSVEDVRDIDICVTKEDMRVLVVLGGQFGYRSDDGVRKDVLGIGVEEGFPPDVSSTDELYRQVAAHSEGIAPTHVNVMPTWGALKRLDLKSMTNDDIQDVLTVADEYDTSAAIMYPAVYPGPIRWLSRVQTAYDEFDTPTISELDLHRPQTVPADGKASNTVDRSVFDRQWEEGFDAGALFENAVQTEAPTDRERGWQDYAPYVGHRIELLKRGWTPDGA